MLAAATFSVTSESGWPTSARPSPDGAHLIVLDQSLKQVLRYDLATAWDISSAVYVSSYTFSSPNGPLSAFISDDGGRLFVVGGSPRTVHRYTLSTAWDVTSASYDSLSVSVANKPTYPWHIEFSPDGLRMYTIGYGTGAGVSQWALSTAWDISTAVFVGVFAPAQDPYLQGGAFSADGTHLIILGADDSTLYSYTLSTAWDVSTASYASDSLDISDSGEARWDSFGVHLSADGHYLLVTGQGTDTVYEWYLATPYTLSSAGALPSGGDVYQSELPIDISLLEVYRSTLAVNIDIEDIYTSSLPVTITVSEVYTSSLGLDIRVADTSVISPGGLWRPRVRLSGVDLVGALTGAIAIDAEARAARTATFDWRPGGGTFTPSAWINQPVEIDYLVGDQAFRLFTGHVWRAVPNLSQGLVRVECSDGLQRRVDGMTLEQIDALTPGGKYSRYVMPADAQGWEYLGERLKTLAADVDLSVAGVLRMTPWMGLDTYRTYTQADIIQGSLSMELVDADQLVNRVEISSTVRLPVARQASALYSWTYAGPLLEDDSPYYPPTYQVVQDAIDALDGWVWDGASFTFTPNRDDFVSAVTAQARRRWVQDVTYTLDLTVHAPGSESVHGSLTRRVVSNIRIALDEAAWVDEGRQVTDEGETIDMLAVVQSALDARLAEAKYSEILASHRHRVAFSAPLDPLVDLHMALEVDHPKGAAVGKVDRVRYVMTLGEDNPTPIQQIWIAVSRSDFEGAQADDAMASPTLPDPGADPAQQVHTLGTQVVVIPAVYTTLPAMPDWEQAGWNAVLQNVVTGYTQAFAGVMTIDADANVSTSDMPVSGLYTVTGVSSQVQRAEFTLGLDAIADALTQPLDVQTAATYAVAIPEEPLTMTI